MKLVDFIFPRNKKSTSLVLKKIFTCILNYTSLWKYVYNSILNYIIEQLYKHFLNYIFKSSRVAYGFEYPQFDRENIFVWGWFDIFALMLKNANNRKDRKSILYFVLNSNMSYSHNMSTDHVIVLLLCLILNPTHKWKNARSSAATNSRTSTSSPSSNDASIGLNFHINQANNAKIVEKVDTADNTNLNPSSTVIAQCQLCCLDK